MTVGASDWNCAEEHTVKAVHTRSVLIVGAWDWKFVVPSHVLVYGSHTRSEVVVGAVVWYSVAASQVVRVAHCRSVLRVAATVS